ncbi:MAG: hypothetical protein LBF77_06590 [Spirochaetaceae bacterium]|jgi:hypothetical protein|nr:hypothetical protein [Spirochaetaceae bacterium]
MNLTGAQAFLFLDAYLDTAVKTTGQLTAATWYHLMEKGASSAFPAALPAGCIFRSPKSGTMPTLASGDRVFPIAQNRVCKTTADISFEQGTVDVSDDCNLGASIPDGLINASGSFGTLFNYDDATQKFKTVTNLILSRFMDTIEDSGAGVYTLTQRSDAHCYLLLNLNSTAGTGKTSHWICMPIVLASLAITIGNAEAQAKNLSWNKGPGRTYIYNLVL